MASSDARFETLLLPRAQADIENIVEFLLNRSPQGAMAWIEKWEQTLDRLCNRPLECGIAPESADYDIEIRHTLFKTRRGRTYRALFTVVGRGVYILNVRAPGQNLLESGRRRR